MQKRLIAALAALPGAAAALTLGDAQLRSHLGEPLDVRIPVTRAAGEDLSRSCFGIAPAAVEGVTGSGPADVAVALRRSSGRAELHVTTASPVADPALAVAIRVACPRGAEPAERVYVLLPEPAVRVAPPTVAASRAPAAPLEGTVPFTAREGDTLASLAKAFAGPSSRARREWIAGMRAANPELAAGADDAPLPASTTLALPTPRTHLPAPPAERIARAPRVEPAVPADVAPPPAPLRARAPSVAAAPAPAPTPAAAPAPRAAGGGFVLRLSAPEVDLTRTQRIDDRMRQQLRERQLVLDQDDQVAALLQMRHSLKQLESRVAELQLRLSTTPTLAERAPAPAAAPAPVPAPAPAPVVAQAPSAAAVTPPEPAAPATSSAPSPAPAAPAAASTPAPAPTVPAAEPPARKKSAVQPRPAPDETPWWMWAAGALGLLLVLGLALRTMRRRGTDAPLAIEDTAPHDGPATDAPLRDHDGEALQVPAAERPAMASDATLATRLPENSSALRRRYIEERFPEVLNGTIALDDANSVIKGARLFYEDGALPRAVELLHFAIEDNPAQVRTWLALFEIYRLERLAGEYAELASRFREAHGKNDEWRKVRYFGREIDPGNALYREDAVNSLETIGPREGRKLAANLAHVDPIAENWLNAPMDFENEVLANELRNALMASASLKEQDLVPNPMPALRHVEMFTVA